MTKKSYSLISYNHVFCIEDAQTEEIHIQAWDSFPPQEVE